LQPDYAAICEKSWIDIAIVRPNGERPLWDLPTSAGIELKWYGNWFFDSFEGVKDDIAKVEQFHFPAAISAALPGR
jgi:hypothetical protein